MKFTFYQNYINYVVTTYDFILKKSKSLQKIFLLYFDITSKITYFFLHNTIGFLSICFTGYVLYISQYLDIKVFFALLQEGADFSTSLKCLWWPLKIYVIFIILLLTLLITNRYLAQTETVSLAMKAKYGETVLKDRGYENSTLRICFFFFLSLFLAHIAVELTGLENFKLVVEERKSDMDRTYEHISEEYSKQLESHAKNCPHLPTPQLPQMPEFPVTDFYGTKEIKEIVRRALSETAT